jgi:uncharacterized protein YwbE
MNGPPREGRAVSRSGMVREPHPQGAQVPLTDGMVREPHPRGARVPLTDEWGQLTSRVARMLAWPGMVQKMV